MDLDELLCCLAEADSGRLRPELCGGRYAAVMYDPEGDQEEAGEEDEDLAGVRVLGEASSVYGALDLLVHAAAGPFDTGVIEDLLAEHADAEDDFPVLGEIQARERRIFALIALSRIALMDVLTEDHWNDPYLGAAPRRFAAAGFVFLTRASSPHQDEAYAVLELRPTGALSPADRSLLEANDPAAVQAAIAGGASVNALDDRGMSPLHHAVARRRPDVVAALLAAGADPALQAAGGNAPHFAALGSGRTVEPIADHIEHDDHWRILRMLVEAGAPVNAPNRRATRLLDLAIRTRPYPQEAIRILTEHGAHTMQYAEHRLATLLRDLPYESREDLEIRVNEVRFRLESGASTQGALHALFDRYGYYEHEVDSDILLALVEEILHQRADDTPDWRGRTALDLAEYWLAKGEHPNYQPVVERLRAFHSQR
ncbi:ankyrin repeat domain-containing protein [Spirillospora sp. CA-142024]|uniref:ankyrin repeat domain-containing protein n=1 Tax=Spirillospora sp. CA-142024 TaxID=3240036 RepID=UPI003D93906D